VSVFHRVLNLVFGAPEEMNGHGKCNTYLYRWHLAGDKVKVYLHHFVGDDWSLDLHDHPKRFVSIGLKGDYFEQTGDGSRVAWFRAPWLRTFPPTHAHRIFLDGRDCWTLVFVGPPRRNWGFWHLGRQFVPWREYVLGSLGDQRKACQ